MRVCVWVCKHVGEGKRVEGGCWIYQKVNFRRTSEEWSIKSWARNRNRWMQVIGKIKQCPRLSVQFSRSVMSDSLQPYELQHCRPPCPSPTPGVHSNSCPSSRWCHPAISSSVIPFSSCPQSLPASVFSNESTLRMRWPKYWRFSFSL